MYCCLSSCIFIHCSTGRMWMMGCLPPPRPSSVWPCRDIVVGVVKRARQWGGCVIRTIRECYRNFRRFLITKPRLGGKMLHKKIHENYIFKARKSFSDFQIFNLIKISTNCFFLWFQLSSTHNYDLIISNSVHIKSWFELNYFVFCCCCNFLCF